MIMAVVSAPHNGLFRLSLYPPDSVSLTLSAIFWEIEKDVSETQRYWQVGRESDWVK